MQDFNFTIDSKGIVSTEFLKLGIDNFESASMFIARLKYKRNSDKKMYWQLSKSKEEPAAQNMQR